ARQLNSVRKDPNYDGVCFHCQQSIEKYLKARLEEAGIGFPRTHDLIKLLALAVNVEPKWGALQPVMVVLNPYAIAYRYPGFNATKSDAKDAIQPCRRLRRAIRVSPGLPI
ncbi:MAG: HEPN domain-containing protein, partial [Blastocatellia bacterium]